MGRSRVPVAARLLLLCAGSDAYAFGARVHPPLMHPPRVSVRRRSFSSPLCRAGDDPTRAKVGLPKSVQGPGEERSEFLRAVAHGTALPGGGDAPFTVLGIETSCDDTGVHGEALAPQASCTFKGVLREALAS